MIKLSRTFPRTFPLFLDRIESDTWECLEEFLQCPLPDAPKYLRKAQINQYPRETLPADLYEVVARLGNIYDDIVAGFKAPHPSLQIEQKARPGESRVVTPFGAADNALAEMQNRLREMID